MQSRQVAGCVITYTRQRCLLTDPHHNRSPIGLSRPWPRPPCCWRRGKYRHRTVDAPNMSCVGICWNQHRQVDASRSLGFQCLEMHLKPTAVELGVLHECGWGRSGQMQPMRATSPKTSNRLLTPKRLQNPVKTRQHVALRHQLFDAFERSSLLFAPAKTVLSTGQSRDRQHHLRRLR